MNATHFRRLCDHWSVTQPFAISAALAFVLAVAAISQEKSPAPADTPPIGALCEVASDSLPKGGIARIGTTWLRDTAWVNVVAFSADGKRLAWGCEGGRIQICDAATGKPQLEVRPNPGNYFTATELAFSPDGRMLAAGGYWSKVVWVWDLNTRQLLHAIPNTVDGHGRWAREYQGPGFAFTPDSRTLIVGGKDGGLHLWDAATGKELATLSESKEPVFSLTLTSDGRTALTAHYAGELHLWDVANSKHLRKLSAKVKYPQLSALAPDGKTVAFASRDTEIELWDRDGERRHRLTMSAAIEGLGFTPDGSTLHLADEKGTVTAWDVRTGKAVRTITCERNRPSIERSSRADKSGPKIAAWFRADGKMMARADIATVVPWDLVTGKEIPKMMGYRQGMQWAGFSADGKSVYAGGSFGELGVWDAATGQPRATMHNLRTALGPQYTLATDRRRVVIRRADRDASRANPGPISILFWDPTGQTAPTRFREEVGPVYGATLTPDNRLVVTTGGSEQIRVFDAATKTMIRSFAGRGNERGSVFSPDGTLLATIGSGKTYPMTARLYDFKTGHLIHELKGTSNALAVAFSPDGKTVATGHIDPQSMSSGPSDSIYLWDIASGREIRHFVSGHRMSVSLTFSADGRLIVSGGYEGGVRLWETASGQERRNYDGHRWWVNSVDFAPDGLRIVSASTDGTALIGRVFDPAPAATDLATLWVDLSRSGTVGHAAIGNFIAAKGAVAFLAAHLKPAVAPNDEQIARWIADLGSQKFADRESAHKELALLGELAEPALERGLANANQAEARKRITTLLELVPHTEKRPEQLRALRAVEVLERIDTADARRVLERLAAGFPGARLTQDAKASLKRLERR